VAGHLLHDFPATRQQPIVDPAAASPFFQAASAEEIRRKMLAAARDLTLPARSI
jgi:hypothetical protein